MVATSVTAISSMPKYAASEVGVVPLPDIWSTIHSGDVTIVLGGLDVLQKAILALKSGKAIQSDYIVICTGWSDHSAMVDDADKNEIGLPMKAKASLEKAPTDQNWERIDRDTNQSVKKSCLFCPREQC